MAHSRTRGCALAVVADIPAFMEEAQFLLAQLQARTL